ncbi:MAG: HEPN domain-containing protein, partial [Verrucomicrobia bacterium]|nr:HEPN domain-containing protein [Verrucomicrobiota bacterium]
SGFLSNAVSRIYYFLLHNVRALLLTKGLEPRSHEAALRLFSLHFVKTGPLPTATSHLFSRTMKYREEADYNPSYQFTKDEVQALFQEADDFASTLKQYI